jgi:hypothetical protein
VNADQARLVLCAMTPAQLGGYRRPLEHAIAFRERQP